MSKISSLVLGAVSCVLGRNMIGTQTSVIVQIVAVQNFLSLAQRFF